MVKFCSGTVYHYLDSRCKQVLETPSVRGEKRDVFTGFGVVIRCSIWADFIKLHTGALPPFVFGQPVIFLFIKTGKLYCTIMGTIQ